MGLFDKFKKLSDNLNAEKVQGMIESIDVEGITTKLDSVADSMTDKIESIDVEGIGTKLDSAGESIANKIHSINVEGVATKLDTVEDSMTEKIMNVFDKEEENGEIEFGDEDEDETEYEDEEEDNEELKARKKERNKKIAKGFAKGAMFVGSFLYAQKAGADSGSSLMHAFKKSKDVDNIFGGNKKEDKKKDKKKANDNKIKSIAHYEYICPKNRRGHSINVPNIDIPTADGSGCPSREEAIDAIMKATGVDKSQAHSIWNGGATSDWHKVSYTYINDGKPGGTVKCK